MSIFRKLRSTTSISQAQEAAVALSAGIELSDPHLKEALRRWTLVAEGNPEDIDSRLGMVQVLGKLSDTKALDALIESLDQNFSQVRSARLVVARHYMDTGRNEDAIKRWLIIEEQYPDQHESTNNLAYLYLREKQFEQALKMADVLAEKKGAHDRALKLRARVHQSTENWSEAIVCWQQLLLSGHNVEAEVQLITAYLKSNEFSSATALIEQALIREPGNDTIVSLKFCVLVRQEKWQDALEVVDFLRTLRPESGDLLYKRASVLYQLKRYDKSETLCEELLQKSPSDIPALTLFARIGQARVSQLSTSKIAAV